MGIALRYLPFLAFALACERLPARTAQEGPVAAPDTIVRRVVRITRTPSMMQRATGVVHARRALEPLDSVLAIRVSDQRGVEMRGVPVRWTLAGAAADAQLRVINATTDSLGLSRAAFTPGRSASAQGPIADVAGVGRIDFAVTVPVSSIRVVAENSIIWSGDATIVRALLEDDAGNELAGGRLAWATADTSVLDVRSVDSLHARVTGRQAGTAALFGWIGTKRGASYVSVRPVVTGHFITADGRPVPRMRVELRAGAVRDTPRVENGQFSKRIELPPETVVDVRATPISDASGYHDVHLRVLSQRELQDLRIALVPTSWRIDAGTYAGQQIGIDATRAMQRGSGGVGAPFWRLAPISGRGPRKLLGWSESHLPLRIAFDRGRRAEPISTLDSAAFWDIASQMQKDIGATLFMPAELPADTNRAAVVRVEVSSQATDGHTFVAWDQSGNANDGIMVFRYASTLRDPHVVTHELLHLLGFGHAASWTTVSQPMGGRERRLTPTDVAYVQLAMRLRKMQQLTGARPGLPLAVQ